LGRRESADGGLSAPIKPITRPATTGNPHRT
jgi:hypothetical protein